MAGVKGLKASGRVKAKHSGEGSGQGWGQVESMGVLTRLTRSGSGVGSGGVDGIFTRLTGHLRQGLAAAIRHHVVITSLSCSHPVVIT